MYDRHTTRSRGFGFVTMDVRAVAAAVDDQARDKFCHQLDGKHFEVRPATPVGASPPPAPPGVGIVNRPAGDLDALLTGAPARAPSFTPSAPRPGGYQMPPPNGAMYAPPPPNFGLKDVCRDFQNGRCTRGDSCKYVHAAPGAPPPAATWMPPAADVNGICRDFQNGRCTRGDAASTSTAPICARRRRNRCSRARRRRLLAPLDCGTAPGRLAAVRLRRGAQRFGLATTGRRAAPGRRLRRRLAAESDVRAATIKRRRPERRRKRRAPGVRAIEGNLKRQRVALRRRRHQPRAVHGVAGAASWRRIAAAGVDGAASSLFNESPLAVKLAAMDAGPVTGSNPERAPRRAVLTEDKVRETGGCLTEFYVILSSGPPSRDAGNPHRPGNTGVRRVAAPYRASISSGISCTSVHGVVRLVRVFPTRFGTTSRVWHVDEEVPRQDLCANQPVCRVTSMLCRRRAVVFHNLISHRKE